MASRSMAQPDCGVTVGVDTHGDAHVAAAFTSELGRPLGQPGQPKAILCPLRMDPDNLEPDEIALDELRPGRVVRRIQAELRDARVDGFDVRPPLAVVLTNCRRFASNPTGAAGSARLDDTLRTWFDRLVAIKKAVAAGRR
jgi:hypothetical protein